MQKFSAPAMKGLLAYSAPAIVKGMLQQHIGRLSINEVERYVDKEQSLWELIDPEYQEMAVKMARAVNNVNWLTAQWAVDSARKDNPLLASLFLGDESAYRWLEKQAEIIRNELKP